VSYTTSYDICVDQGAYLSLPITATGLTLTGASAEMSVRQTLSSATEIMHLSTANSKIQISGQTITLIFTAAETSEFSEQYVYDLFVTTSDNKRYKIMAGKIVVYLSVTR